MIVPTILEYLSLATGRLSDNMAKVKIKDCPKNGKTIESEDRMSDKFETKITSTLEALVLILMIIYYALATYYGIPIGDSSMT